jgi:hypothetical protein
MGSLTGGTCIYHDLHRADSLSIQRNSKLTYHFGFYNFLDCTLLKYMANRKGLWFDLEVYRCHPRHHRSYRRAETGKPDVQC